ncbi:MAG: hypothetical protein AAF433_09240 [Bacteroidota bacterium]
MSDVQNKIIPADEINWDEIDEHLFPASDILEGSIDESVIKILRSTEEQDINSVSEAFHNLVKWVVQYWGLGKQGLPGINMLITDKRGEVLFSSSSVHPYLFASSKSGTCSLNDSVWNLHNSILKELARSARDELAEIEASDFQKLSIKISSGTAPSEIIADFLSEISLLYSKMEGSGINFSFEGVKLHENVDSYE